MGNAAFHADERAAQARVGRLAGSSGLRDHLNEQARTFFAGLPHVFLATADGEGWPLATVLEGAPGLASSPDPSRLGMHALPASGDPAAGTLAVGQEVGLLGIELSTRRRNRANGVVCDVDGHGFSVAIRQSFGNCPQYIQRRIISRAAPAPAQPRQLLTTLDDRARTLIARADTFFVATRSRTAVGESGGADLSHRGGRPGFVAVEDDTLVIPDFRGNGYFNTLGNILGEPRSALLFLDFETGDVLQLQGIARIGWDEGRPFEGAERLWHLQVVRGWYRPGASTLRATLPDYSPMTLRTGTWDDQA